MTLIYGTDNSNYQPSHFPLTDGHTHSSNFAFIKATQGTAYVNPKLVSQVAWARAHGLVVGLYHFLEKGGVAAQVKHFRDTVDSLKAYVPGDIIAVDWESYRVSGKGVNVSNADKDAAIATALKTFPRSKVVLYCNKDYWLNHDTTSICGDGLWIAAPDDPDGSPGIRHAWTFQQTGTFNNQDQDVAQFESKTALTTWANERIPHVAKPTTFHEVVEFDGIKAPAGAVNDPDGTWTLSTYLQSIYNNSVAALKSAEAAAAIAAEIKKLVEEATK